MKAAEIIQQCRKEFSEASEADTVISSVLSWLSQEHMARQMLARLPDLDQDPLLHQINILFANLYSEFSQYLVRRNKVPQWQSLFETLQGVPKSDGVRGLSHARSAKSKKSGPTAEEMIFRKNYLQHVEICLSQLVTVVLREIKPDAEQTVSSAEQLPEMLALPYAEFFQVLRQRIKDVESGAQTQCVSHNRRLVKDWWFGLEDLPYLPTKSQQTLYDTLLAIPFTIQDEHFERLERLFFNSSVTLLTPAQQAELLHNLPLLLLDAQATENCIWLLIENGFVVSEQASAQVHLWQYIDVLRCFMPLAVEALQALSQTLAQFAQPEQSAFWELLNLDALRRAAKLAVGQSEQATQNQVKPTRQSQRQMPPSVSLAAP